MIVSEYQLPSTPDLPVASSGGDSQKRTENQPGQGSVENGSHPEKEH